MEISIELDLSNYYTREIIQMIEDGIITSEEVIASGRSSSLFSDELETYIHNHPSQQTKCG